jgi:hypothetical protein
MVSCSSSASCGPPSPGWRAFLRNHAPDIAAMDLFVAPTMDLLRYRVSGIPRLNGQQLLEPLPEIA